MTWAYKLLTWDGHIAGMKRGSCATIGSVQKRVRAGRLSPPRANSRRVGRITGGAVLRIGIAGCGKAARIHLDRLVSQAEVTVVGCADSDRSCAESLASRIGQSAAQGHTAVGVFSDHRELLRQLSPDALCVFTPHLWHYRLAMDALQAGSHVFIEKPLSTNVQEATDIAGLARGRSLTVAVGHSTGFAPAWRRRAGISNRQRSGRCGWSQPSWLDRGWQAWENRRIAGDSTPKWQEAACWPMQATT